MAKRRLRGWNPPLENINALVASGGPRLGAARGREQPAADLHPAAGSALGAANLMTAFAAALDALFANAHLARDVVYTAEGGMPALVRAILRWPDDVTGFGEARIWSETTRLDLRLTEVTTPRPGDRIEIDDEAFLI